MLNDKQKSFLLKLARESIIAYLENRDMNLNCPADKLYFEKKGAFVSLHLGELLRGCIGHIKGYYPLFETIKEMAVAAASNDPRFQAVSIEEMNNISIEISILSELILVEGGKPHDIVIGRDGLYIESPYGGGLLLPQVAEQYQWDQITFLKEVCHKAGLPADSYLNKDCRLFRFSADVFSDQY